MSYFSFLNPFDWRFKFLGRFSFSKNGRYLWPKWALYDKYDRTIYDENYNLATIKMAVGVFGPIIFRNNGHFEKPQVLFLAIKTVILDGGIILIREWPFWSWIFRILNRLSSEIFSKFNLNENFQKLSGWIWIKNDEKWYQYDLSALEFWSRKSIFKI